MNQDYSELDQISEREMLLALGMKIEDSFLKEFDIKLNNTTEIKYVLSGEKFADILNCFFSKIVS